MDTSKAALKKNLPPAQEAASSELQPVNPSDKRLPEVQSVTTLNNSLKALSLESGKAEAMDTSIRENSDPKQQIEELNQLYTKHMEKSPPPLSQTQCRKKNQTEKNLAQCKEGSRQVQLSHQHELKRLQKNLDSIDRQEQLHPWHKEERVILMAYCKSELATFIPLDIISLLRDLLSSENSVLEPKNRLLIRLLNDDKELITVIENNPKLAEGTLDNMGKVVFQHECWLVSPDAYSTPLFKMEGHYSGISFKEATFPSMTIHATFRDCDFSNADFTGTYFSDCDFRGANFTAACFAKCTIISCNFDQATLTGANFSDLGLIMYTTAKDENFSNTVRLLYQAIIKYTRGDNSHQAASALRSLAYMLLGGKQLEKAEEVFDELVRRQQAKITDFFRIGRHYSHAAHVLNEEDHENKMRLTRQAIAWLQKGWQKTSDSPGELYDRNDLFIMAMEILPEADSTFNWRSVVNDIKKSKSIINDTHVLTVMARLLTKKQADGEAMETLTQLVNDPKHLNKGKLAEICKIILEIILRNKAFPKEALTLLDKATALTEYDHLHISPLDFGSDKNRDICTRWLYRIDLLLQSGRSKDALKLISEMESTVSGARQMLVERDYDGLLPRRLGGPMLVDLVTKIRDSLANIKIEMEMEMEISEFNQLKIS